jgi:hypothetical protein
VLLDFKVQLEQLEQLVLLVLRARLEQLELRVLRDRLVLRGQRELRVHQAQYLDLLVHKAFKVFRVQLAHKVLLGLLGLRDP